MLILFDIDGTLLVSQRAGVYSMQEAGRELFGEGFRFDGIDYAGRLDPWIWGELARMNGIANAEAMHGPFRAAYARRLAERLLSNPTAVALPGVLNLLAILRPKPGVTLGVLTGNYPETGRLKITAAGIDLDQFHVAAWGDDGATRRDLPPVALDRYAKRSGGPIDPQDVVIIGDTPHDIDCARAHGCRSLGVATGGTDIAVLRDCGADRVVADLSDTASLAQWLVQASPATGHVRGAR